MTKSHLPRLQKIVGVASSSENAEGKAEALSEAFNLFSSETKELLEAHRELKERYQEVNRNLEAANQALEEKVAELDYASLYLNSILDNIAQGVIFVDSEGIITTYNSAAENILQINSQKVLFQSYWQYFPDDLLGFSMRSVLTAHEAETSTCVTISKQKPQRLIEVNARYLLKASSAFIVGEQVSMPQGLIILIRDVSEIKRLESLAKRNDKMKELGEMAAMVAHEIRNPLGGIKGFASLLQRDLQGDPELRRLATYIVEGTDSLNRLVNDILDYSHPMKLQLESTNLVQLMDELILHLNADDSIDPRIELHSRSSSIELFAVVDGVSLKSAVMNLATNAIQAMPEGGELNIDVDIKDNEVVLKVSDTGVGIPNEIIQKIFSPFFTTRPKGHGLGLAEVYRIVQAHDGVLEVSSEVSVGSIFTIRLPFRLSKDT
jgi:signal transduction histidine kinase